jgi:V/A-type H+-transporting ATPase subunit I
LPGSAITIILIMLLLLMLFKEPLGHLIKGVRPLCNESKSDYYIEGGFGVVETLLSLFSNTVSFIRVGAFAINHVGLFIAFDTLAGMMSNGVESMMMIIFGNIIIIGLEGLIVFIQGLRLEYYELFSKYFVGTGYEYTPCYIFYPFQRFREKK